MDFKPGQIYIRKNNCLVEVTNIDCSIIKYRFLNTSRVGKTDSLSISFFSRLHTLASPSAIVLFGNNKEL